LLSGVFNRRGSRRGWQSDHPGSRDRIPDDPDLKLFYYGRSILIPPSLHSEERGEDYPLDDGKE